MKLFPIVLCAVNAPHNFPMFRKILLYTIICCLWLLGPWKMVSLTRQEDGSSCGCRGFWSQVTGQQDSVSPTVGRGPCQQERAFEVCSWAFRAGGESVEGTGGGVSPLSHLQNAFAAPGRILPCFRKDCTSPHFPHMSSTEAWGTPLNWLVLRTLLPSAIPLSLLPPFSLPLALGAQLLHLSIPEETQL